MPHNLYLHSSIVQTRAYERTNEGKAHAIKYGTIDSSVSLFFAFFINCAILILAASVFFYGSHVVVDDLSQAYNLLSPALGAATASALFGVALLASGQSSTITGTLAGQIVMEGFLQMRLKPWVRRLVTRTVAIIPATIVAAVLGNVGLTQLLILSQVILSLQLSVAVVPVVHFTSCQKFMGPRFANAWPTCVVACVLALTIAGLNSYLVITFCMSGNPLGGGK